MAILLQRLFQSSGFTPHGFCLAWDPALVWLQAGSDLITALSYYSIPLALAYFVARRQDLAFRWVFLLFALFIMACGTTHLMDVVTLWIPAYWVDGIIKALTAVVSLATALLLWPLLPKALALPSPARLAELNGQLDMKVRERDAAARELEVSEARYRALFDHAPVPMHTLDNEGRIIAVTDHWLDLLGYSRAEVMGVPITRFQDAESAEAVAAGWRCAVSRRKASNIPRRFVRRSGEVIDVLVAYTVDHRAAGELYLIASVTDITERRRAEMALKASEDRLRQAEKLEAVGQLTGGIAHDFNNVLTVIMGSMELLKRRLGEDRTAARLLDGALEGGRKAARLTSQLLTFARRQRLEPQALDAVEVAMAMEPLLVRSAGENLRIEIAQAADDRWCCMADRNQLEAALLNLVLNARGAIAGQGAVRISCRNYVAREDAASGQDDLPTAGEYVCISVEDNGAGMTEEVRRRAFEPFYTTKPPGQGSGLGLAQIYGFARQSGGLARIASTDGVGTRVDILLPRAEPACGSARAKPVARSAPRGSRRTHPGSGGRAAGAEDGDRRTARAGL